MNYKNEEIILFRCNNETDDCDGSCLALNNTIPTIYYNEGVRDKWLTNQIINGTKNIFLQLVTFIICVLIIYDCVDTLIAT